MKILTNLTARLLLIPLMVIYYIETTLTFLYTQLIALFEDEDVTTSPKAGPSKEQTGQVKKAVNNPQKRGVHAAHQL